jgi:hypothetical protein
MDFVVRTIGGWGFSLNSPFRFDFPPQDNHFVWIFINNIDFFQIREDSLSKNTFLPKSFINKVLQAPTPHVLLSIFIANSPNSARIGIFPDRDGG